jgi:hypothetical protein
VTSLDDRPLSLTFSRDGKRLLVVLPYEIWVLATATLELERSIELPSETPSVFEADEGQLWIGGTHLHRSTVFATGATKTGTKLGGFVDHVCLARPRLLCGIGTHGEILYDLDKETVVHRRKASEHEVFGAVPSADGRAVFVDGNPYAWVVDPDHASGYMKLGLRSTSPIEVESEGLVAVGMTSQGRAILAARDGAVGWTNRALRLDEERVPRIEPGLAAPLAVGGDARWIYVLRPAGILHRFLVEQPEAEPGAKEEPDRLPEAQTCRLPRRATCLALDPDGHLVLAGPRSDDHLGQLWRCSPEQLQWEPLPLSRRTLAAEETEGKPATKAPSFIATRSKISGPALSTLRVDDVLAGNPGDPWVTRDQGNLVDRPVATLATTDILGADALVLPAMIRFHEGTARPALLVWPGVADEQRALRPVHWLTWGDEPREWIPLDTPAIRKQGWTRREVFPLQIALARALPDVPGRRPKINDRWVDAELFAALGRECKKLLKVLW